MTTQTISITGMTCRACEVTIEKRLKSIAGVTSVKASTAKGQAVITSSAPIPHDQLRAILKKAGYALGVEKRLWLSKDRVVWRDVLLAVVGVGALVGVAYALGGARFLSSLTSSLDGKSLWFIALIGVTASLSTCMAVVGGLVTSLSATYAANHPNASAAQLLIPNAWFNLGRVVGFALLGALIGLVGKAISLSGPGLAIAMIVVGVVMFILGIKLTEVSPRLGAKTFALPPSWTSWMHSPRGGYRASVTTGLGALSFFLPCGFTQAVQVFAISTGDPVRAGLVMGVFALGTTPGLMALGAISSLSGSAITKHAMRVIGVVVLAFSLVNIVGGLRSLGLFPGDGGIPGTTSTPVEVVEGIQHVSTEAKGEYSPKTQTIKAGVPVEWTITATTLTCANWINATSLGISDTILVNYGGAPSVVTFTVDKPGTYTYTCGMGMYRGSFVAL
ncbi:MAG: sulfite exporter TauE/SafE family protein [Propionibacteriaceae bacterium]|jgi:sulfite exporter TauE/SafE/copper chaperone CopZ|nr:sulfite exporter TauE/SafE family protein [Propionibacteriaceae bacterium]